MSLGIVIKGPEGLILASESRVTLTHQTPQGQTIPVSFDNATKLLSFHSPNDSVGVVTYGLAGIGLRTAHSFIPEIEAGLPEERLPVADFANHLSNFFMQQWQTTMPDTYSGPNMTFVVAGFNEGEVHGRVYLFDIPRNPNIVEQHQGPGQFGITWGGQREIVDRLIRGYDSRLPNIISGNLNLQPQQLNSLNQELMVLGMPIPLATMPLQDCIDLAIFFIRTTINAQRLTVGIRGCGGPIDVAIITRGREIRFVQRKEIIGEMKVLT